MGFSELLILLFIALILFGPEDLPDIARAIGRVVFEIRKVTTEMTREFNDAMNSPSSALRKAFEDSVSARPDHSKESNNANSSDQGDAQATGLEQRKEDAELLSYDDEIAKKTEPAPLLRDKGDPLAGFPKDMITHEKKETSR